MALDWGPHTKAAAERQAAAIRKAATSLRHHRLAEQAAAGEFTDYSDSHPCGITALHDRCRQFGLHDLALRVANGEFDATSEESDEWAASPSGKGAFARVATDAAKRSGEIG